MSKTRSNTYTNIENEIIDDEIIFDTYEKFVLIVLLRYAKKNEAYPSIKTIASKIRCSNKTVARTINRLEEKGIIVKENRTTKSGRMTSNLYKIADIKRVLKQYNEVDSRDCESLGYKTESPIGMGLRVPINTLTNTNKTNTNKTKKYSSSLSLADFMNKYDISVNYEKALLGISSRIEISKIEEVYLHALSNSSINDKVAYTIATLKNFDSDTKEDKRKGPVTVPIMMNYDWINDKERK